MIRKPFYRKFRKGFYETLSEKGASVLRYRGADNKEHYIAAGNSANVMPGGGMVETTWAELKALRDAGKLVAGQLYRITDYTTTTAQEMTQAAGHDFDVIVLALGSRSLSEDAWAAPREGDGYFCFYENEGGERMSVGEVQEFADEHGAELPPPKEDGTLYWPEKLVLRWEETCTETFTKKNALNRWRLRYCLDNDKSRFAWADDSVDEGSPATLVRRGYLTDIYVRSSEDDTIISEIQYYGWVLEGSKIFTESDQPEWNDPTYTKSKGGMVNTSVGVESYTPAQEGTGLSNGRGVIYRLTDEWGNSLPFDFKNIKLDYEESGEYAFVFDSPNGDESMDGGCSYVTMEDCFDSSMYIPIVRFTSCNNIRLGYDFAGEVANCNYVDVGDGCNLLLEDVNNVTYANDGGRVLTENYYSEIINASNS